MAVAAKHQRLFDKALGIPAAKKFLELNRNFTISEALKRSEEKLR